MASVTNQRARSPISIGDLAELNSLLEVKQLDQFWVQSVALLHRWTGAACVRLYWADDEKANKDIILHRGEVPPAFHTYCGAWERHALQSVMPLGLGEGGPTRTDRIQHFTLGTPPTEDHGQDPAGESASGDAAMPRSTLDGASQPELDGHSVMHIDLVAEGVPYGILSFVYGLEIASTVDAEELLSLVDLLTTNFIRAQALEAARDRLESVSLLYQFNQAVTSLDLDEVLWDAAELVAFLLNAQAASIILADAEQHRLTFMVATGEIGSKLIGTHIDADQGIAGWVAGHGKSLIVNDPAGDDRFLGRIDEQSGFRTQNLLCTPLIVRSRTIGVMLVLNRPGGFSEQDQEWTTAVSSQISIALENARLYTRQNAKVRELATLNQVSQAITSELDAREVINGITNSVLDLLAIDRSELLLIDPTHEHLDIYSAAGISVGHYWAEEPVSLVDDNLVGWCAREAQSVSVERVGSDARCAGMFDDASMANSSMAVVPLINRGSCIGVIVVYSVAGLVFDDERMNLLQTFANQAAVALENATLNQNLQVEQERIISIQEEVRHQLARDLHDGPAQMLSSIVLSVDLARRFLRREQFSSVISELDRLEEIARQANREVRTLLFELRPIILESRGLVAALHAYHRQLSGTITSRIILEIAAFDETFSPKASNSIFAIIQESVNNIRKHAKAQNIWVRVWIENDSLVFEVEDDGVGMNLDMLNKDYAGRNSFGLLNMRERASILGGKLSFRSPRSGALSGTKIVGIVPLVSILGQPDEEFSLY